MRTTTTCMTALLWAIAHAQTFTTWTITDGLPSNDLRDVAVGPDGIIWLATAQGVVSFDGGTFTTHNTTSHPGLASNDVYAIAALPSGEVMAGTDFGLSVFDGSDYTTYTTADGLGGNQVKNIKQGPDGAVWVCTSNGATRIEAGVFTAYGSPQIPFGGSVYAAFPENGQVLLAGGLGGLIVNDNGVFSTLTTAQGLVANRIRSIAIDGAQRRWVGTSQGITVLDAANARITDHTRIFQLPAPDTLNPITDVVVDGHGRIWAGVYVDYLVTEGGVSVYANEAWSQFEAADGLAGPNVRRLAVDAEDNIWVTTSEGLTRISDVGIGMDERPAAAFSVFPNPADASVDIVLIASGPDELIELRDASGRLVTRANSMGGHLRLPTAHLASGMYTIHVGSGTHRLLVTH